MIRRALHAATIAAAVLHASPVAAQRYPATSLEASRLLFAVDTVDIGRPALSADGVWLVYGVAEASTSKLSVVNTKTGRGRALAVSGKNAVWFPAGNRLAFLHPDGGGISTIGFDPRSGTTVGPARLAIVDRADEIEVSPNGREILYQTRVDFEHAVIKAVSESGGAARTIARTDRLATPPSYSANGDTIFFAMAGATAGSGFFIYAVPSRGGEPAPVFGPYRGRVVGIRLDARHRRFTTQRPADGAVHVLSFTNDTLLRVDSARAGARFPSMDSTILLTRTSVGTRIGIVPVAGGPPTLFASSPAFRALLAWPAGTDRILYVEQGAESRFMLATADGRGATVPMTLGGVLTAESVPNTFWGATRNGRYWLLRVQPREIAIRFQFDQPDVELYLYDSGTGISRQLTAHFASTFIGSTPSDAELPFAELRGDTVDIRLASVAASTTTLLRSFPIDVARRSRFAVFGQLLAWATPRGDSTEVFVDEDATVAPRRLAVVRGSVTGLRWSPIGNRLAMITERTENGTVMTSVIIRPVAAGAVGGRDAPASRAGNLQWLPDGSGVMVHETIDDGASNAVRLIPSNPALPTRSVTAPLTTPFFDYLIAPDGKSIAITLETVGRTAVYRIKP